MWKRAAARRRLERERAGIAVHGRRTGARAGRVAGAGAAGTAGGGGARVSVFVHAGELSADDADVRDVSRAEHADSVRDRCGGGAADPAWGVAVDGDVRIFSGDEAGRGRRRRRGGERDDGVRDHGGARRSRAP